MVAPQGLADLLAVGIAPPALYTADSFMIQSGVECHAFSFLLVVRVVWVEGLCVLLDAGSGSVVRSFRAWGAPGATA